MHFHFIPILARDHFPIMSPPQCARTSRLSARTLSRTNDKANFRFAAPEFAVVTPRLPGRRRRRWTLPDETSVMPVTVALDARPLGRRFELELRPSPALLDPQFVLLRRGNNRTEMLSPLLAEQSCFYRSDAAHRAAVALCGGMVSLCSSLNRTDSLRTHQSQQNSVRMATTLWDGKKNAVFWDELPCDSCKNRRFGETYRPLHQDEKNQQARNSVSITSCEACFSCYLPLTLFLPP
jgi:hypothetical protein